MKTLGIITARSGSKGVKDKNIRELCGKPLIAYTIEASLKCHYIDETMVSTDSEKYAEIARKYGAEVPFMRSEEASSDNAKSIDVLFEVIENYEKMDKYFDTVVLLQPTSPLRTYKHLNEAFDEYINKKATGVISVCECEYSPLLCNTLNVDLSMENFFDDKSGRIRRQDLQKFYRINGAIYILDVKALKENNSFYSCHTYAYIMTSDVSIDIDSELDFKYLSATKSII